MDLRTKFLCASVADRIMMLREKENLAELRAWLGAAAIEDYLRLAADLDGGHLGDGADHRLVFVPGVMGSVLVSRGYGGIAWLDIRSRKRINRLRLAPGGTADADERADIVPVSVDQSYEGFFIGVFKNSRFSHQAFPYDWRKPLLSGTRGLADQVVQLSDKAGRPVHLVAHSMGGLLVRATLMRHPELWRRVGKVVFLGTPHYGSPAIAGYLKNHLWGFELLALLGRYLDRATFRSLWGVLSLLPAPVGVYPDTRSAGAAEAAADSHPCANFDLYSAAAWELGVDGEALTALQTALDAAATLHRALYDWHRSLDQDLRDRMLVIAGVGYRTLFRTAHKPGFGFLWRHMDRISARQAGNPHREGDGRVPLASAQLEWVGETRYARVEHGRLPATPAVYSDVLAFLEDRSLALPTTPEAALRPHLGSAGDDALTPALSAMVETDGGEDPGYLNFADFDERSLDALELRLESGGLPAFNRVRLL